MNEKSGPQNYKSSSGTQLTRVTRLLRRTQDCLQTSQGRSPTYLELEEWTDTPQATIKDWFNNKGRPTAEFVLQLLERMSKEKRGEIIDAECRLWPSIVDPRLQCGQTVVSLLKTIVRQPRGLVIVQGGNDEIRTFVVTALGNAFIGLTSGPHLLSGIDIHEPDWFVPLPGVRYLHNLFEPKKLKEAARQYWPGKEAQLVVLNGLANVLLDFRKELKALSAQRPVIVTESGNIKPSLLKRCSAAPIHIVTVSQHPENSKGINVVVEAI